MGKTKEEKAKEKEEKAKKKAEEKAKKEAEKKAKEDVDKEEPETSEEKKESVFTPFGKAEVLKYIEDNVEVKFADNSVQTFKKKDVTVVK